ncbi:hypothetical protein [Enhygromyxa salina]|uniref:Uncharacterized protein n=1 Tax=Enhygromyxa salina TaxID=215803 RepID=A0A2S9XS64_9BACT|nr:hypothetical protein [Enhygromyxa salina]PRP95703.1 hypothetical protein ENSA7_73370 [Enhygromyxa salina]
MRPTSTPSFPYDATVDMLINGTMGFCSFEKPIELQSPEHPGWHLEEDAREHLFRDETADERLIEGLAGRGRGGKHDRRLARRARKAAKLVEKMSKRGKTTRAREIAREVFSFGIYQSQFDAKRAQRKLGKSLAQEIGGVVELLEKAELSTEPVDSTLEAGRDERRRRLTERLSAELIAQSGAVGEAVDVDVARAAAVEVINAYMDNVPVGSAEAMPLLVGEGDPKWDVALVSNGAKDHHAVLLAVAMRTERETGTKVSMLLFRAILDGMSSAGPEAGTWSGVAVVGLSYLSKSDLSQLETMAMALDGTEAFRIWGLVIISEANSLAKVEGTNREAAIDRILLAGTQLQRVVADANAQVGGPGRAADREIIKEGFDLFLSNELGTEGPVMVKMAGRDVPVFVHPAVDEDAFEVWTSILDEAVGSFPQGLIDQLIGTQGEAGGNPFRGFRLYPGSSGLTPGSLVDGGIAGVYSFEKHGLTIGVDVSDSREKALDLAIHELCHRLSDILVNDSDRGTAIRASEAIDSTSALQERLATRHFETEKNARRDFPGGKATIEQKDPAAQEAGIVSYYASYGDFRNNAGGIPPEEYLAESCTKYLYGGLAAATLRRVDPELYWAIGYALWLANTGKLERARKVLLDLDQPPSEAQVIPPPSR